MLNRLAYLRLKLAFLLLRSAGAWVYTLAHGEPVIDRIYLTAHVYRYTQFVPERTYMPMHCVGHLDPYPIMADLVWLSRAQVGSYATFVKLLHLD